MKRIPILSILVSSIFILSLLCGVAWGEVISDGIPQEPSTAITGGTIANVTIDNSVIGGTTPAAGTFDPVKITDTDDSDALSIIWNEDDSAARTINLKVNSGDRTLDLSENLTVGGGTDVTITATGAAGSVTLTKQTLEIEGEGTTTQLTKIANANNAAATLTIEGTSAVAGQDTTSDASPTFTALNLIGDSNQIVLDSDAGAGVTTTITDSATAARVITIPDATDTLVGKATTDTFTNKTIDTAGTGNSIQLGGAAIAITSVAVDQHLGFDGTNWVNLPDSVITGGGGVHFYLDDSSIIATGANNDNALNSLTKEPAGGSEVVEAISVASNTVLKEAHLYNTVLGSTSIEAGQWVFDTYASVSATTGGRVSSITRNIYHVVVDASTITTTGSGTSRTATAAGGTPFVSGDANATESLAGFVQTPQGLYQITAFSSGTVVTITTPSGYTNEVGVAFNTWKYKFGTSTGTITALTTNYLLYETTSIQAAITIVATDKLGEIIFGVSNNTTTVNYTHNGTDHYSHFTSPLLLRHNDLAGLNAGDFQHMTAAEDTGTGTGVFVRANTPTLVTPEIGAATGTSLATSAAIPLLLTNGELVSVALTSQTTGPATITIPDFASVADTFVFKTKSETLSNKTFVAPVLGAATATSINKVAITAPATSATLTILDGKTLTANNSLVMAGTDGTTMTFPSTSATVARTDAGQTFTGVNVMTSPELAGTVNLSGGQIAFPSTQSASADTNTLDDYEEGTYTITVTCAISGTVTLNSSLDMASYVKIGRLIHIQGFALVSSVSSPVGSAQINLPFTADNPAEDAGISVGSVLISGIGFASDSYIQAGLSDGATFFTLQESTNSGGLGDIDCSVLGGADQFRFGITYITDG